jgi:hypothetical protein
MAALRVRRVDFVRKRLTVAESATEVGGTVEYGRPKTHQQRTVPIPGVLLAPLSRRFEGKGSNDLVLTSPEGAMLRSGNFRRRLFDPVARAAGLDDLCPHDLGTPPRASWWPAAPTSKRSSGCSGRPPPR